MQFETKHVGLVLIFTIMILGVTVPLSYSQENVRVGADIQANPIPMAESIEFTTSNVPFTIDFFGNITDRDTAHAMLDIEFTFQNDDRQIFTVNAEDATVDSTDANIFTLDANPVRFTFAAAPTTDATIVIDYTVVDDDGNAAIPRMITINYKSAPVVPAEISVTVSQSGNGVINLSGISDATTDFNDLSITFETQTDVDTPDTGSDSVHRTLGFNNADSTIGGAGQVTVNVAALVNMNLRINPIADGVIGVYRLPYTVTDTDGLPSSGTFVITLTEAVDLLAVPIEFTTSSIPFTIDFFANVTDDNDADNLLGINFTFRNDNRQIFTVNSEDATVDSTNANRFTLIDNPVRFTFAVPPTADETIVIDYTVTDRDTPPNTVASMITINYKSAPVAPNLSAIALQGGDGVVDLSHVNDPTSIFTVLSITFETQEGAIFDPTGISPANLNFNTLDATEGAAGQFTLTAAALTSTNLRFNPATTDVTIGLYVLPYTVTYNDGFSSTGKLSILVRSSTDFQNINLDAEPFSIQTHQGFIVDFTELASYPDFDNLDITIVFRVSDDRILYDVTNSDSDPDNPNLFTLSDNFARFASTLSRFAEISPTTIVIDYTLTEKIGTGTATSTITIVYRDSTAAIVGYNVNDATFNHFYSTTIPEFTKTLSGLEIRDLLDTPNNGIRSSFLLDLLVTFNDTTNGDHTDLSTGSAITFDGPTRTIRYTPAIDGTATPSPFPFIESFEYTATIVDDGVLTDDRSGSALLIFITNPTTCNSENIIPDDIGFGNLLEGATSPETPFTVLNSGTAPLDLTLSAADWIASGDTSNSPSSIMSSATTRFATTSGEYDDKTGLTSTPSGPITIPVGDDPTIYLQLEADLNNKAFTGAIVQTISTSTTCF